MNTIVNERKLDFFDIMSEGLKIFFFKFGEMCWLALVAFIPSSLMVVVLTKAFPVEQATINPLSILMVFLVLLAQLIAGLIVSVSMAVIIEKVVENKTISFAEAVKYAASKWGKAFTTSLLASVITFGLSLLLVIPGIIYWTYYSFVLYVVALRDKHGKEALNYSKALVMGQWWRIFGILLGLGIIFGIFDAIITYPLRKISENPYFAIIPNAVSLFLAMIFGVMSVVLFLNNDFVYHRRLTRRIENERAREVKRAPTIDEYLATREGKTQISKSSLLKKVAHKTENKTTKKIDRVKKSAVKKRTVKKGTKTVHKKIAS